MRTIALFLTAILLVSAAIAQQPAPQQNGEKLQATITGIEGLVQVRDNENQPWRKAEVNMVVTEDAEFRTGPKSAVRFVIPPDQTITLDRLGTVKLLTAIKTNGKIKTDLGMKYGRTRYDIEAAGQEHESTISSPSSTLAVRGTKVSLYDQRPFPSEAVSLTGRADFKQGKKQLAFGGKNAGKMKVESGDTTVSALAFAEAVMDPTLKFGRAGSEKSLVANLISRGATVTFDRVENIRVVTGGTHPLTDAELIPTLPGNFNFVLRWDANVNLNTIVSNETELLFPASGLNTSKSGGKIDFDHRGGPNGGIEIAYWQGRAPAGSYSFAAAIAEGHTPVPATFDVYLGGTRIDLRDASGNILPSAVIVNPAIPGIAEGTLAGLVVINPDGTVNTGGIFGAQTALGAARASTATVASTATPVVKTATPKATPTARPVNTRTRGR